MRRGVPVASLWVAFALTGCAQQRNENTVAILPEVTVVTLQPQTVNLTRELPGRTSAYLVAEVRPQVSGIVRRRWFTEGAEVRENEPLYEIDASPFQAQYASAKATLEKAVASLGARTSAARRAGLLIKTGAISLQDNDMAVSALGQSQADVDQARAAVDVAKLALTHAHIVAPISGQIGKSSVTQGALVIAEQTAALATIQQIDPLYVDVHQSSSEWLSLREELGLKGSAAPASQARARVQIILENGTLYSREGRLQFVDSTVNQETGDLLLRVLVPNPERMLMPGMYVRAVICEGTLTSGLLAPQQSIVRKPDGSAAAFVVDHEDKVALRPVTARRAIGNQWLIDSGLSAGDRVIVEGSSRAEPGMRVRAVETGTTHVTSVH